MVAGGHEDDWERVQMEHISKCCTAKITACIDLPGFIEAQLPMMTLAAEGSKQGFHPLRPPPPSDTISYHQKRQRWRCGFRCLIACLEGEHPSGPQHPHGTSREARDIQVMPLPYGEPHSPRARPSNATFARELSSMCGWYTERKHQMGCRSPLSLH